MDEKAKEGKNAQDRIERAWRLRALFTLNLMDGAHRASAGSTKSLEHLDAAAAAAAEAEAMLRDAGCGVDAGLAADVLQAKALAEAARRACGAGMPDVARKLCARASDAARDAWDAVAARR